MSYRSLALLGLILHLSGCSANPIPAQLPTSSAPSAALLSADWLRRVGNWPGADEHRIELAEFRDGRDGTSHLVRYDLSLTARRIHLAAQTTIGLPLYESTLAEGKVTTVRHTAQLESVPVEKALEDLVLAIWPLDGLVAALQPENFTVEEVGNRRLLKDQLGVLFMEVLQVGTVNEPALRIIHYDLPLEITIRTVARDLASP